MDISKKTEKIEELKKKYIIDPDILGPFCDFNIVRYKQGEAVKETQSIATEVPFTIKVNDIEVVTLLCLPANLKELAIGFLFTSSFITSFEDFISFTLDTNKWIGHCEILKSPDPEMMRKRLFTSGCGKGVMYGSIDEMSSRYPIKSNQKINKNNILDLAHWLQHCSSLYKITSGVHTAAISLNGDIPEIFMDDVGRHNAVDKIIGKGLKDGLDFSKYFLVKSGRTSSEILQKAKRANIAIIMSRGAPTHQTILKAREMGVTVIGFARAGSFTVYSYEDRVLF